MLKIILKILYLISTKLNTSIFINKNIEYYLEQFYNLLCIFEAPQSTFTFTKVTTSKSIT